MKTYTVQRGDSLFKIAKKFYGDGEKYKQLAAYNGMENPNALEVGQVLSIPEESALKNPLSGWHNYRNGSIWWRVTAKGIEIKGKGLLKNWKYNKRSADIWKKFKEPILKASKKHGVPVPVIIATISTESSGEPESYRHEPGFYRRYIKGKTQWKKNPYYKESKRISASYGLMQIMYTTAYSVGFRGEPEDLYDPERNIDAGAAYIASSFQRKQHGWDPPKIACAYNAGSVRATNKNSWGMFHHPGHLDRWIPSYNGAIKATGATPELPEIIPEPIVEPPQPQPQPAEAPAEGGVTVKFIFPKAQGKQWKPLIIDVFEHDESGLGEQMAFEISSVASDQQGNYEYNLPNLTEGMYDFVFTDAATSSVVNDVAEVSVEENPTVVDLREVVETTPLALSKRATLRFQFPKIRGQAWKPVIIDMFSHKSGGTGEELVSFVVKIPLHGPGGEYIYDIPDIPYGVYDFVFTDSRTQSVINDIADCNVNQPLAIIQLTPDTRGMQRKRGRTKILHEFGTEFTSLAKEYWTLFWEV